MKLGTLLTLFSLTTICVYGQSIYNFKSVSGNQASVDDSLDGWTVADHYGGSNYNGFVGDLGLIFDDQTSVSGVQGTPEGTFRGDVGELYEGILH